MLGVLILIFGLIMAVFADYIVQDSNKNKERTDKHNLDMDKMWSDHEERMKEVRENHKKLMLELEMITMGARDRANLKWNMKGEGNE